MTQPSPPRPVRPGTLWHLGDRLGVRFVLLLALSLLPLGLVSLAQTHQLQAEIQRRTEAALLGETLRAASAEIGVIRNAQGIVASLASSLPVIMGSDTCSDLMRSTARQIPTATLLAFLPTSGLMTCSSNGSAFDFSASPLFHTVLASQAPNLIVNRRGPVSGTSVLGISHPVFDAAGRYLGYVSLSLPHERLERLDKDSLPEVMPQEASVVFWTFDREGEVLTASVGLDRVADQLPAGRDLASFVGSATHIFHGRSVGGQMRTYAAVRLVEGQLYLMSSSDEAGPGTQAETVFWPYLTPVTMWIVGLIVAGVASERLVTRHIRVLNTSILRFAKGDRGLHPPDMSAAPVELREVGQAFQSMTHSITRGEADLEDSIHQKEVLLREVHHRMKNNLQLIASIMNIQMRKAIAPEAKILIKGLQDRVMSLATIHRGLYQTSGLADVRADELFRDIVRQIINLGSSPDKKFALDLQVDDLHLTPDQAVPLSLLLTEAMTNAMKYASAPRGQPVNIIVRLRREDGQAAVMEVVNSLAAMVPGRDVTAPPVSMTTSTGLGDQLLTAFAQQVGGTLEREITESSYRLSVHFEVRALDHADPEAAPDS